MQRQAASIVRQHQQHENARINTIRQAAANRKQQQIGNDSKDGGRIVGTYTQGCAGAGPHHEGCGDHDLEPARSGDGLERSEQVRGHVGELETADERVAHDVTRPADAGVGQNDVDETWGSEDGDGDQGGPVDAAHATRMG